LRYQFTKCLVLFLDEKNQKSRQKYGSALLAISAPIFVWPTLLENPTNQNGRLKTRELLFVTGEYKATRFVFGNNKEEIKVWEGIAV
jgi:hypothetical protein